MAFSGFNLSNLDTFENSENIHGGSNNNIEAPHVFSLNFWKAYLGLSHRNRIEPILSSQLISYLKIFRFLRIDYEMQTWNFLNNLEAHLVCCQVGHCIWVGGFGKVGLPHFNCLHMLVC